MVADTDVDTGQVVVLECVEEVETADEICRGCRAWIVDRFLGAENGSQVDDAVGMCGEFHHGYVVGVVEADAVTAACRDRQLELPRLLCEPGRFIEAIIAPAYDDAAFEALTTRPKWKNNVRLLKLEALNAPRDAGPEYRRISGGLLVQDRDEGPEPLDQWQTVTERPPTDSERADLHFAWAVAKHVKSNAIVFAKDRALVGVGAGQMSRLDSVHIAHRKAGDRSQGASLASDAFFPFRDGLDQAAAAGITAVAQPGGSRGDDAVIQACDEHNMAMVFTGRRHFKH